MISDRDKALVQSSFESEQLNLEVFIPEFYERFFASSPDLRKIFPEDTSQLEVKMLAALTHIAEALEDTQRLDGILNQLGDKHHQRRISDDHFNSFIQSFTAALAHLLGCQWGQDHQDAWTAFLTYIAIKMQFFTVETAPK